MPVPSGTGCRSLAIRSLLVGLGLGVAAYCRLSGGDAGRWWSFSGQGDGDTDTWRLGLDCAKTGGSQVGKTSVVRRVCAIL